MKNAFLARAALAASLSILAPPSADAFTIQVDSSLTEVQAWASSAISFDYNYADCISQGVTADQLNTAVDSAFAVWNSVLTSSVHLSRGSEVTTTNKQIRDQTTAGNPLILCDSKMAVDITPTGQTTVDTDNIPAVTQVLRVDGDRHIALAVVYINAEAGKQDNVANIIDHSELLQIVFAHEIGHAIGLGHSVDTQALMYFDASKKTHLALARDDVDGITFLYPRQELFGGSRLFGCATVASGQGRPRPGRKGGTPLAAIQFVALLAFCAIVSRLAKPFSNLNPSKRSIG